MGRGTRVGLVLHFIVGPMLGLIFGLIILMVRSLRVHDIKKGMILGFLAGIVTIPFGCVPTAILSHVPVLKLVSFSAIPHEFWGQGLGWVTGYGLKGTIVQ